MRNAARVYCSPATKGNRKQIVRFGGRTALVSSARDKRAERELIRLLAAHAPEDPLDGPLRLELVIYHAVPRSWPGWRRRAAKAGVVRPSGNGTPDCGNVLKLVEDALEAAEWITDDARTVSYSIESLYAQDPGYFVVVETRDGCHGPKAPRSEVEAHAPAR